MPTLDKGSGNIYLELQTVIRQSLTLLNHAGVIDMPVRLLFFVCLGLLSAKAYGQHGAELQIQKPVKIVTDGTQSATAELTVLLTWKNPFDHEVIQDNEFPPRFVILDDSGKALDSFVVTTKPEKGQSQFPIEKKTLKPGESSSWPLKIWVDGLALEPGRRYRLKADGEIQGDVTFIPSIDDQRWRYRPSAYEQVVKLNAGEVTRSATVFSVDNQNGIATALTVLPEQIDTATITPLYEWKDTPFPVPYVGEPLRGSVKRAKNGIAIVSFNWPCAKDVESSQRWLPLGGRNFDYATHEYFACGFSDDSGVQAPCSAIRNLGDAGFSTVYATPLKEWPGSGYFSDDGYLVGICESGATTAHGNRLGYYFNLKAIYAALDELGYRSPAESAKK